MMLRCPQQEIWPSMGSVRSTWAKPACWETRHLGGSSSHSISAAEAKGDEDGGWA